MQLRFPVSNFMMFKLNLYSNKVLLSSYQVLYDLEPDILVVKRFIVPFLLRIILYIFIVYSIVIIRIVYIMFRFLV
jgi:hypothetical protein